MITKAITLSLLISYCLVVIAYLPITSFLPLTGSVEPRLHLTTEQIEDLVVERAELRKAKRYAEADVIKALLESNQIIVTDYPDVNWRRIDCKDDKEQGNMTLMDLARLATQRSNTSDQREESKYEVDDDFNTLKIVRIAKQKLRDVMKTTSDEMLSPLELRVANKSSGLEYTGRYMVDCALKFSFAGVKDEELFRLLEACVFSELKRFGGRSSCRVVDVLQIVEKLAVSGQRRSKCYTLAAEILMNKKDYKAEDKLNTIQRLKSQKFSLLDDRPLLWLFRNSAKQTKQTKIKKPYKKPDIDALFEDPTLPLYIDLGCGYGVANLALSSNHSGHNTLGCDTSRRAVDYAESISWRWGLNGRCRFINCDAETCLQAILSSKYSGTVDAIIINFPSPYKQSALCLDGVVVDKGNAQLPSTFEDFLVTDSIVELSKLVLQRNSRLSSAVSSAKPFLLMQSNVEDVAITMKNVVERSRSFKVADISNDTDHWTNFCDKLPEKSLRHRRWGRNEGIERAYGVGWLKKSPFDGVSKSETEVNCDHHSKPVFRRQMFLM